MAVRLATLGLVVCLSIWTVPARAAELVVEVTVETLGRLLEQNPIANLTIIDQAQTDKLTLIRARYGDSSSVTITVRELEHDPPRSKVLVLTDTPVNAELETRLASAIAATAEIN